MNRHPKQLIPIVPCNPFRFSVLLDSTLQIYIYRVLFYFLPSLMSVLKEIWRIMNFMVFRISWVWQWSLICVDNLSVKFDSWHRCVLADCQPGKPCWLCKSIVIFLLSLLLLLCFHNAAISILLLMNDCLEDFCVIYSLL